VSIYRFNENSLLDEVTIERSEGGGVRAYLHARDGASNESLKATKIALTANAMQWTPILHKGKPVLEIRGLGRNENKLLQILGASNSTSGKSEKVETPDDKINFKNKFKKNTLSASGWSYFIGDVGFLTYGWKKAFEDGKLTHPQELLAGIFYAMGTPFIAFFGRGDKSNSQFKHLSYTSIKELEGQGIEIPRDAAIRAVANGHNDTVWKRIVSFCERYPAEICNAIFGVAGAMIFWGRVKDYKRFNQEMKDTGSSALEKSSIFMDFILGTMTMLGGLISIFIDEELPKPGEPKKTGLARAWQWIKEKPLRAAGFSFGISTVAHAFSTAKEYKKAVSDLKNPNALTAKQHEEAVNNKTALPGRALFVASNLTAEVLMGISSKGHGHGVRSDMSFETSSYAVMADLIMRNAPEKRESLLNTISEMLSHKKHLNTLPDIIKKGISEQMEAMSNNPWIATNPQRNLSVAYNAVKETPVKETDWGKKVLASQGGEAKTPEAIIRNIDAGIPPAGTAQLTA